MSYLFTNDSKKETDEWWPIQDKVDKYNKNRQNTILTGLLKVFDESMLAYQPQTMKTGNLPHLSHIVLKPENLGTKLKVTADCTTQMLIHLEIQCS